MIHLVQKTYLSIVDNEKNLIWNSYNSREGFSTEQFSANVFLYLMTSSFTDRKVTSCQRGRMF